MAKKKRSKVFIDVSIGNKTAGRITFELFNDIAPKAAENFRGLCTGEYGRGLNTGMPLSYEGCRFFRVMPGQIVQCGDFEKNTGEGGESIYGGTFRDENFIGRHAHAGVLSMANRGRNSNGSQFFVTLEKATQFDGKHVAFGQVVGGMDVLRAIEKIPVHKNDVPRVQVLVIACGELTRDGETKTAATNLEVEETVVPEEPATEEAMALADETAVLETVDAKVFPTEVNRLLELKLKLNQSRVLNTKSVVEERKMDGDPKYREKILWKEKRDLRKEEAEAAGLDSDDEETEEKLRPGEQRKNIKPSEKKKRYIAQKEYLSEPASSASYRHDKQEEKEKNIATSFGWQVFSQDSLYRAHEKRLDETAMSREEYESQKKALGKDFYETENNIYIHGDHKPTEFAKDRLVGSVEKQIKKRSQFQRRRPFYEEMNVTHINERNRKFNRKLDRFFKNDTAEIKANLERGTAL